MDNDFELSRRKALAALGTIGAASAGAGLGTSAYFSDQETFENNSLVAGELDLKVSWDEHYSDWKGDETEFASMPGPDEEPDLLLPAPSDEGEDIELVFSDRPEFMNATRQEQFPEGGLSEDDDPCTALADVPDDLDQPVIDLEDVKPGDFGEVTFDFASCTNPAFLWLNGGLVSESENGQTEPEEDDPDEGPGVELPDALRARAWYDNGGSDNTASASASLQAQDLSTSGDTAMDLAQTLVAGDVTINNASFTGSNQQAGTFSGGGSTVGISDGVILSTGDVEDVAGPNSSDSLSVNNPDASGTTVLDDIATGSTNDEAILEVDFTVPDDADQIFFNYVFGSEEYNEYVDSNFNDAFGLFLNGTNVATIDNPDNPGEDTVSINNINNGENADLYNDNDPGDLGTPTPFDTEMDGFTVVLDVGEDVVPGSMNTLEFAIADVGDSSWDSWVLIEGGSLTTDPTPGGEGDNIKQDDETVFIEGSLRDVLSELSSGNGIPLDGDVPAEEGGGTGRNCYAASPEVHYVAFQWWLPIDHGNEVQSDSVTFDLGFYAEQCRHNDGSGMNNDAVAPDETNP
jgi:predicted ribosomally synthesized peptide with SipW-like signal peptide